MTSKFNKRRPLISPVIFFFIFFTALMFNAVSWAVEHGLIERLRVDLLARPSGPMWFRFLLQPFMASIAALRDGIKDARTGRSPYFWTVLTNPAKRSARLREGIRATSKIIVLAVVLDGIYQYIELKTFYPFEALIVGATLGFIPYLLLRGPVGRVARWWHGDASLDKIQ